MALACRSWTFLQGGNKWKGDPEAEAMTSRSSSPALSNLPLPLISLTPSGMWQVERFTVMQLKFIQPFFSITAGNGEGKKEKVYSGSSAVNSWEHWRSAIWEESEGGEAFCFLIMPDLHALGADSRPFFWCVLCNCPLTVGMQRKRKVQNTLQRCQSAVANSWAELQRLAFKDGITSRHNF